MSEEFNIGDIVKITGQGHFFLGNIGKITHIGTPGGSHYEIVLRDRNVCYASALTITKVPRPEVGDLVRVTGSGRWQAQEGNVIGVDDETGLVSVDLEHDWEKPVFAPESLDIIEKVPPLPKREVGQPVKAKDVRVGDKVSVKTIDDRCDILRETSLTATVGKIVTRGVGNKVITFQTSSGTEFYSDEGLPKEIVLLEGIESDLFYRALSALGPGSVIVFASKPGEPETNMAIKQHFEDVWHVVDGSKDRKPRTVGLVNILRKKGVPFSVLRMLSKEG
jgi:hypothetical protein